MATAGVRVPLDEYLSTVYEPDCEYVDGVLEDRNVGKKRHSRTQTRLALWLGAHLDGGNFEPLTEQRVKISSAVFRIPDVCVQPVSDNDEVTERPPVLWVEILSPEDRWSRIDRKIRELQAFGVPTIWIIDPYSHEGWTAGAGVPVTPSQDGVLRCETLGLEVSLGEVIGE